MLIGVSELLRNISIFKNLTVTVHIMNKKTEKILSNISPSRVMKNYSLTDSLGGILHRKEYLTIQNIDSAIENAYDKEMRVKYSR